ncbi:hypothetical protein SAMD00079811_54200 [Scytonema sp. HK-05]|nr:hypothetical protein NIES2130_34410 [Scytonema sp. HK-05]BAY47801.1 hypothetical protein SAMD00079811_54200 [Scytonema sp. HK-05]
MKNVKLGKLWDALHSSYWFIPTVIAVLATALAFIMLSLDCSGKAENDYTGGADGARSLQKASSTPQTAGSSLAPQNTGRTGG